MYAFILEKMIGKLSSWKAASLSFARWVTLAHSSLASIPGYTMQTTAFPVSVIEEAKRICRDFIWGSSPSARKCHLISWSQLCKPKDEGGLGFRNLRVLNEAYMMEIAWQLMANPDKIWVQVMKKKYKAGPYQMSKVKSCTRSSPTWRAICQVWPTVSHNISWVVNNGEHVRFWKDVWILGLRKLESVFPNIIPLGENNFTVSSYVSNSEWKWDTLQRLLPAHTCNFIASIKPPQAGIMDTMTWCPSSDGTFTIKSAYNVLQHAEEEPPGPDPLFVKIWKWGGPQRIKSFLWKLAHGRLLTNDERQRRHMCSEATCSRCL